MGERKGVNKYYPPDFDYKKHGSLDRYHNSHPLRERARKLKSEGILIIRFEMPYNIWCEGCNSHIGMGVRYNAEKKKIGNYYSTIIYKFRMKCHLCPQHFEIQTDPANCDYKILSGARRKEERWDAKANEQIEMTDHAVKKQLLTDPMFKLEHGVKDKRKLESVIPSLSELQDFQEEKKDDYLLNKALRNKFRSEKKRLEETARSDKALLDKSSLDIKLLPESEEDKKMAELLKYQTVKSLEMSLKESRSEIIHQPILPQNPSAKTEEILGQIGAKLPKSLTSAILSKSPTNLWSTSNNSSSVKIPALAKNLGIKVTKRKRSASESETKFSKPAKHSRTKSEATQSNQNQTLTKPSSRTTNENSNFVQSTAKNVTSNENGQKTDSSRTLTPSLQGVKETKSTGKSEPAVTPSTSHTTQYMQDRRTDKELETVIKTIPAKTASCLVADYSDSSTDENT
uniref:coiled-coil domain-containing protein 130 n=1 Tax=Ciona intestinalis TaxID=7719 RepID=UPI000180D076|nr:coiled-coil domain-containing protein 130 [Ciona intestinalis]|eukprot:XP_002129211.1 coiled-coil domain-containing protein 130 [Ciona intestinalis]